MEARGDNSGQKEKRATDSERYAKLVAAVGVIATSVVYHSFEALTAVLFATGYFGGALLTAAISYWRQRSKAAANGSDAASSSSEEKAAAEVSASSFEGRFVRLYEDIGEIRRFVVEQLATIDDLLEFEPFRKKALTLKDSEISNETLLGYYRGDAVDIALVALGGLLERPPDPKVCAPLLASVQQVHPLVSTLALRVVDHHAGEAVLNRLGLRLHPQYWEIPVRREALRRFVASRLSKERPEDIDLGRIARENPPGAELLRDVLEELDTPEARALLEAGSGLLEPGASAAGHLPCARPILETEPGGTVRFLRPDKEAIVPALVRQVTRERRSLLVCGEAGTGKTALLRHLAAALKAEGWAAFVSRPSEIVAGMRYVGDLEERLGTLIAGFSEGPVLWVLHDFHQLLWVGRHAQSPVAVLDLLLPHIESRALVVAGEIRPEGLRLLLETHPHLRALFDTIPLEPADKPAALAVAERWVEEARKKDPGFEIAPGVLEEAYDLVQAFLRQPQPPGSLLELLERARRDAAGEGGPIDRRRLIRSLSGLTGLPESVIDDRQSLDVGALQRQFSTKVLGQPEAVRALVERIAMVKAGLTDPTRPLGVFLFAGPTGTGKTELAKTLAEYLFGTQERLIRLDMSEFKTPDAVRRLLAASGDEAISGSQSLVQRVREQPFSVILLDEFEKAHPAVWDLFLQVFDDGRLTDTRGDTVDFRHTMVILTSNVGAPAQGRLTGFGREDLGPTATEVFKETFPPEFLNRLDRVVVFRPLGRNVLRDVLRKELAQALQRRGLRSRSWAVEFEESALEFLLDRGFDPELGARPLRRAIERHLLAPLAEKIVEHRVPEGDQFLFVKSDGRRLVVDFVDLDQPEGAPPETAPQESVAEAEAPPGPGLLALHASGSPEEVAALDARLGALEQTIASDAWRARKEEGLARMSDPAFWSDEARFAVLGEVEYRDRIEAGVQNTRSLLERLRGKNPQMRKRYPPDLVRRLALEIHLLEIACTAVEIGEPYDAFLLVEGGADHGTEEGAAFARRLGGMYKAWARKRNVELITLIEEESGRGYSLLLALSGFGAYALLEGESGIHILELPGEEAFRRKARAMVTVVPQPLGPPGPKEGLLEQARRAIAKAKGGRDLVRVYREKPSPLVRDARRGWRTGRLDLVLGGDFDLF